MHLAVYIGLNCLYFIFGVILVNAIRKEFFSQAQKKIFQPDSQKEIFIPMEREKSNYYLNELLKQKNLTPYDFKQQSIPPAIETISLSKLPKRLQQLKTSVHINKFTYHKQESKALSLFYNLT